MRAHWKKKTVVLTLGLALVVGGGGAAFAYWTTTGTGTGTATTGTTSQITVNQTSTVTGLYPGGPAVPLSGTFTNPSTNGSVFVTTLTATVTGTSNSSCGAANYAIAGTATGVGKQITTGDAWGGLTIQMLDSGANQDVCKGATVNISYTTN
jgi:hypothetical protein